MHRIWPFGKFSFTLSKSAAISVTGVSRISLCHIHFAVEFTLSVAYDWQGTQVTKQSQYIKLFLWALKRTPNHGAIVRCPALRIQTMLPYSVWCENGRPAIGYLTFLLVNMHVCKYSSHPKLKQTMKKYPYTYCPIQFPKIAAAPLHISSTYLLNIT